MNVKNTIITQHNTNKLTNITFKAYKEYPINKIKKDSFEYSNAQIKKELRDILSSLIICKNEIYDILDKKTPAGIRSIINLSKQFNTNDGLTFKNFDETNNTISFELNVLKNNYNNVRIIQKDYTGQIKNAWLIVDYNIVKNYNPQNKLPETLEFYYNYFLIH